jgi:hypothetical protein
LAHYGWSLAIGDINGDGFRDLAVGAPWEFHLHDGKSIPGMVYIYNGSLTGPSNTSYWID